METKPQIPRHGVESSSKSGGQNAISGGRGRAFSLPLSTSSFPFEIGVVGAGEETPPPMNYTNVQPFPSAPASPNQDGANVNRYVGSRPACHPQHLPSQEQPRLDDLLLGRSGACPGQEGQLHSLLGRERGALKRTACSFSLVQT